MTSPVLFCSVNIDIGRGDVNLSLASTDIDVHRHLAAYAVNCLFGGVSFAVNARPADRAVFSGETILRSDGHDRRATHSKLFVVTAFTLARRSKLTAMYVGAEGEAVLESPAAFEHPEHLVDLAASIPFAPAYTSTGGYPGLRASLPDYYIRTVVEALAGPISEAFSLGRIRPVKAEGAFSLVTLPGDALSTAQRAPHVDSTNPHQFAILHYLCDEAFGGTSFFRHRATGFETLSEHRLATYRTHRATEGVAAGYVDDGAPWFEPTARVSAGFNRLVAYRSCVLHSGHVPASTMLSPDPRSGRLTANVFVTFASVS